MNFVASADIGATASDRATMIMVRNSEEVFDGRSGNSAFSARNIVSMVRHRGVPRGRRSVVSAARFLPDGTTCRRSLVISHKLLGTLEWFVIHHTNCGMELFADEAADLLEDDLGTAGFDGKTWSNPHHHGGHAAGHFIKWHTIGSQPASVAQDVRRILRASARAALDTRLRLHLRRSNWAAPGSA